MSKWIEKSGTLKEFCRWWWHRLPQLVSTVVELQWKPPLTHIGWLENPPFVDVFIKEWGGPFLCWIAIVIWSVLKQCLPTVNSLEYAVYAVTMVSDRVLFVFLVRHVFFGSTLGWSLNVILRKKHHQSSEYRHHLESPVLSLQFQTSKPCLPWKMECHPYPSLLYCFINIGREKEWKEHFFFSFWAPSNKQSRN